MFEHLKFIEYSVILQSTEFTTKKYIILSISAFECRHFSICITY